MNRLIKLLAILFCINAYSQSLTMQDTLAHVKYFETNKAYYIGKPFSVLLNDLNIKPKLAMPGYGRYFLSAHTYFVFAERAQMYNYGKIRLIIKWYIPIKGDEASYYAKKNNAYFTEEEEAFYGSKIVNDIWVERRGGGN